MHDRVRREIYNECIIRQNNYPDITIETEERPMHIINYINHIQNNGFYGGELEISLTADLYNINIETHREILNDNNEIIGFRYINYYNHNDNNDNNENRHLMILTNIDNIHFRLAYDSYKNIDMQFNIANENLLIK